MSKIERFEDFEGWQVARALCVEIYRLKEDTPLGEDFGLWGQINRSSGSIMDNIAEGFGRDGNKEMRQFFSYAKGSANEMRSQCHRMLDRKYITEEEFEKLDERVEDVLKRLGGFMKYLKNTELKGTKFKR